MSDIGFWRRNHIEVAWVVFAGANLVAMQMTPDWETIPFHFIWVSLTIVYGFRVWPNTMMAIVLAAVALTTGALILGDAITGAQRPDELFEVPLMSAMFLAMVWHARRRQTALHAMEGLARERAELLDRQERLLHNVSHELRTPVTIARGHLELLARADGERASEVTIAIDELDRITRIVEELLLLAKAERPDFVVREDIHLEPFLEDVFMRWSEVAPRAWRLGPIARGVVSADPHALRVALDALIENAVQNTTSSAQIELGAEADRRGGVLITVADGGPGIPEEALGRIFERFGRADAARARRNGGVGLGLSIVAAVASAHDGECLVESTPKGSTFALRLPRFRALSETSRPPVVAGTAEAHDWPVG